MTVLDAAPARIQRDDVTVMLRRTGDTLAEIQRLWPEFERLVGVRGRRMYAMVDTTLDSPAAGRVLPPPRQGGPLGAGQRLTGTQQTQVSRR
jgi:hypothetical protein